MINDCGSCRRLHAAPRGHGAPVDVTLYEANLNETRLQVQGQKKKKKKVNTVMSFNNAFPAHFHPPIIPFWISRETLPTPPRPTHTISRCCFDFVWLYSFAWGRRVSISCAHTQSTLCDYYFSCLTQIAYGVAALRGYAQQISL